MADTGAAPVTISLTFPPRLDLQGKEREDSEGPMAAQGWAPQRPLLGTQIHQLLLCRPQGAHPHTENSRAFKKEGLAGAGFHLQLHPALSTGMKNKPTPLPTGILKELEQESGGFAGNCPILGIWGDTVLLLFHVLYHSCLKNDA